MFLFQVLLLNLKGNTTVWDVVVERLRTEWGKEGEARSRCELCDDKRGRMGGRE